MDQRQRGATLVEVIVATAIIGILSAMAVAAAESALCRYSLAAATIDMRLGLFETRMQSMTLDKSVALKFRYEGGAWNVATYLDGDGDGIRNDDIQRGIDKLLKEPRRVCEGRAHIGLPPFPVSDPVNGGQLNDRDAVRFGSSTLCSISPDGDFSNGSIVLTDGKRVTLLVINGSLRRISTYRFDGARWSVREL